MLYDSFSKAILNPEVYPERLNDLLSQLLGEQVTILEVLPTDNSRITDESSLVVMDILVKLTDGSIANVEIQRIGYLFPGQRSACYSADLLLRQYVKVRNAPPNGKFSYCDIKSVYTIVLFQKSPTEFHAFPDTYVHKFRQKSDSGLEMDLLQKYVFVPLDNFLKSMHNKPVRTRLQAWLTFLASDDPDDIIALISAWPEFKAMYEQIYKICQNVEDVMGMFSEELRILDRNTVNYMIDEMSSQIEQQSKELEQKTAELAQQKEVLDQKDAELAQQKEALDQKDAELAQKDAIIRQLQKQLQKQQ